MPGPEDETPPEGTQIPDERPTQPLGVHAVDDLVPCPECGGQAKYVRYNDIGRPMGMDCKMCNVPVDGNPPPHPGKVTRDVHTAWYAGRRSVT